VIDVERIDQLVDEVRRTFPRATDFAGSSRGAGCARRRRAARRCSAPRRTANLWLDVGHGALGFTLALATGRIVADLARGPPARDPARRIHLH
jgi:D-amino-acid dehydrogenase